MDERRIDAAARLIGGRRPALRALLGLGLAVSLGLAGADFAGAGARCKIVGRRCRRDRQCCTRKCRQGRCKR